MSSFVRTRRFWPLFGSYVLGAFADNTLRMATIAAIFAAWTAGGGGRFALPGSLGEHAGSLVSVGFTLPVMLFSLIAGQVADRRPRVGGRRSRPPGAVFGRVSERGCIESVRFVGRRVAHRPARDTGDFRESSRRPGRCPGGADM